MASMGSGYAVEPLPPVSMSTPTEAERAAAPVLNAILTASAPVCTGQDNAERELVIQALERCLREFVAQVGVARGIYASKEAARASGGNVYISGSYRLGVSGPGADVDAICVTPRFVTSNDFFEGMTAQLRRIPGISKVRPIPQAAVPMTEVELDGIEVDLLLCRLERPSVPPGREFDILDDLVLKGADLSSVRSLNGPRTTELLVKLVPNYGTFRVLLRATRLWCKRRGLYSNKLGFLGGVNLAILCVFICQRYPERGPVGSLFLFFYELERWRWPDPVFVTRPYLRVDMTTPVEVWDPASNPRLLREQMPIITPAYPCASSTYSVVGSTLHIMRQEFRRGRRALTRVLRDPTSAADPEAWAELFRPDDFLFRCDGYVVIHAWSPNPDVHGHFAGYVESRVRRLVLALESNGPNLSTIYPYPRALEWEREDPAEAARRQALLALRESGAEAGEDAEEIAQAAADAAAEAAAEAVGWQPGGAVLEAMGGPVPGLEDVEDPEEEDEGEGDGEDATGAGAGEGDTAAPEDEDAAGWGDESHTAMPEPEAWTNKDADGEDGAVAEQEDDGDEDGYCEAEPLPRPDGAPQVAESPPAPAPEVVPASEQRRPSGETAAPARPRADPAAHGAPAQPVKTFFVGLRFDRVRAARDGALPRRPTGSRALSALHVSPAVLAQWAEQVLGDYTAEDKEGLCVAASVVPWEGLPARAFAEVAPGTDPAAELADAAAQDAEALRGLRQAATDDAREEDVLALQAKAATTWSGALAAAAGEAAAIVTPSKLVKPEADGDSSAAAELARGAGGDAAAELPGLESPPLSRPSVGSAMTPGMLTVRGAASTTTATLHQLRVMDDDAGQGAAAARRLSSAYGSGGALPGLEEAVAVDDGAPGEVAPTPTPRAEAPPAPAATSAAENGSAASSDEAAGRAAEPAAAAKRPRDEAAAEPLPARPPARVAPAALKPAVASITDRMLAEAAARASGAAAEPAAKRLKPAPKKRRGKGRKGTVVI